MDDNTLSIIIAEDEKPAREELLHLLKSIKKIQVRGIARDGLEAVELIQSLDVDLALLDIEMPGMNGIEIARQVMISGSRTLFIFTTAYDAFALKAFEVHAVDYLLKPIRPENLKNAIERARIQVSGHHGSEGIPDAFFKSFPKDKNKESQFISIYKGDQIIPIKTSSILFAESRGRFVWICTEDGEYKTNMNFRETEELLLAPLFFVCHRSFIVNIEAIEAIDLWVNNSYRLKIKGTDTSIPVSRSHKEDFCKLMSI